MPRLLRECRTVKLATHCMNPLIDAELANPPSDGFGAKLKENMNEHATRKRIEIAFLDQEFEFENDRFHVPMIGRESASANGMTDDSDAGHESDNRWLSAGQSRYCPREGKWVRKAPLPI